MKTFISALVILGSVNAFAVTIDETNFRGIHCVNAAKGTNFNIDIMTEAMPAGDDEEVITESETKLETCFGINAYGTIDGIKRADKFRMCTSHVAEGLELSFSDERIAFNSSPLHFGKKAREFLYIIGSKDGKTGVLSVAYLSGGGKSTEEVNTEAQCEIISGASSN